jgi:hypothetical protein
MKNTLKNNRNIVTWKINTQTQGLHCKMLDN